MLEKNKFSQIIGKPLNSWQQAKKPPATSMSGKYCILEALNPSQHGAGLFKSLCLASEEQSWTYLPYGPFSKIDEFQSHLQELISVSDNLIYAILDSRNNLPIGISGYLKINPMHGTIEVGHLNFSKLLRKTSAATEAMYLMMQRAFEELGYRRYEWKCNTLNQASIASAKRLGFKFEGIFRQHYVIKGHGRDTAWFSIIDSEWPEIKSKLQKWLDPSNFDHNNQQILRLKEI